MTANSVAAGLHTCTITADDTYVNGVNTAGVFTITINTRPVQNPLVAQTLYKGQTGWTYTSTACTDADLDPTTWTARNFGQNSISTSWLSFNPLTGVFSGTPTDTGVSTIEVVCSDPSGATDSEIFTITVGVNNPPVYT